MITALISSLPCIVLSLRPRPIHGIYNKTAGVDLPRSLIDFGQCGLDYLQNATARLSSGRNRKKVVPERDVEKRFQEMLRNAVVWNKATLWLVKELVPNRNTKQVIIAHSQGNLITANALFVLEDLLGFNGLTNIRVFSLASPAPA